jgi:uncharacterized RDD family membrane protein YckC
MTDSNNPQPAPLWRKLFAMLYDCLIVTAVSLAYGAVALWAKVQLFGLTLAEGEKANLGIEGFIGWMLVLVVFYSFFWHRGGQTLGMRAWRLKLTNRDNDRTPSLGRCCLRALVLPIALVPAGIGYWWQLIDPAKLTWHDRLSSTRVLLLPKQK